eukprot:10299758-Alexandrium_andersonii.AAC.1
MLGLCAASRPHSQKASPSGQVGSQRDSRTGSRDLPRCRFSWIARSCSRSGRRSRRDPFRPWTRAARPRVNTSQHQGQPPMCTLRM